MEEIITHLYEMIMYENLQAQRIRFDTLMDSPAWRRILVQLDIQFVLTFTLVSDQSICNDIRTESYICSNAVTWPFIETSYVADYDGI